MPGGCRGPPRLLGRSRRSWGTSSSSKATTSVLEMPHRLPRRGRSRVGGSALAGAVQPGSPVPRFSAPAGEGSGLQPTAATRGRGWSSARGQRGSASAQRGTGMLAARAGLCAPWDSDLHTPPCPWHPRVHPGGSAGAWQHLKCALPAPKPPRLPKPECKSPPGHCQPQRAPGAAPSGTSCGAANSSELNQRRGKDCKTP